MANWIDKNKDYLWTQVDDCFESLDICDECVNKQACDAVWQIVRQPYKSTDPILRSLQVDES